MTYTAKRDERIVATFDVLPWNAPHGGSLFGCSVFLGSAEQQEDKVKLEYRVYWNPGMYAAVPAGLHQQLAEEAESRSGLFELEITP